MEGDKARWELIMWMGGTRLGSAQLGFAQRRRHVTGKSESEQIKEDEAGYMSKLMENVSELRV